MIKAIKEFEITSLKLSGFKCFAEERSFTFGHMNAILGHNAQGKSTIADAISFAIAGVSFFGGTRLDRLHTPGKDIYVELQFVDGEKESHRLIRQRCGDKTDIFLDGLPITQKEINSIFVERDLFLSVFNPLYFIEVLGNKGRDLFERYTPDISHESVMEHLSENSRSILAQHPFHSPEALCKRTREEIRQLEQTMIYRQGQNDQIISQKAQSEQRLVERKAALEECRARAQELDAIRTNGFDGSDLKEKLAGLYARYEELIHEQASIPQTAELDKQFRSLTQKLEQRRAAVYQSQYAQALSDAQKKVNALGMELNRHRKVLAGLQPGVRCGMCYQVVTEDTLPAVKREFEAAIRNICLQGKEQAGQLQELQELDAKAKAVFESYRSQDIASYEQSLAELDQQRKQAVNSAAKQNALRQKELSSVREEIQNLEMDLEAGMLSPEQAAELDMAKQRIQTLETEIEVLTEQIEKASELRQEEGAEDIQTAISEKKELLTALSLYISERVRQRFSGLELNRVSISLYEAAKTTDEVKDVFKLNYEDRPYICLSLSEKIKTGLEVSELLKKLTGINYPVFIDNGESVPVIDNVKPSGQVFAAQVVNNEQLRVVTLDKNAEGQSTQAA